MHSLAWLKLNDSVVTPRALRAGHGRCYRSVCHFCLSWKGFKRDPHPLVELDVCPNSMLAQKFREEVLSVGEEGPSILIFRTRTEVDFFRRDRDPEFIFCKGLSA